MGMGIEVRKQMAKRAAKEIKSGMIVNLGIGIPSLVANYLSDKNVMIHAENGILGIGPYPLKGEEDPYLCDAAGFPVTTMNGASYFDSSIAFGIIRSGRIDVSIIGSLQVSEKGDLANWIVPGQRVPGIGGAMDLAQKAKKLIVVMNHVNKNGESKIVPTCSLPLTARQCVDMVITERAVFHVEKQGLLLKEVFHPFTVEDILESTDARISISSDVKMIENLDEGGLSR
ncbi:3-oxoacid CoA-transferase subunit B [Bacillus sp. FJAT-47783]|uniref:3-oxoacid CoA-transferase subunit B n=1 Tax=Bacillus sp. FJAT-47783 TaxID=2922712 RepID=UPI001FAD4515|nr:3-oxoacid CoA-transferase subunit B [Bacillus sp. FJAT-47783]